MQETDAQVEGFCLIRIISDREQSKVYIARDSAGALCAVKVQNRQIRPHCPRLMRAMPNSSH